MTPAAVFCQIRSPLSKNERAKFNSVLIIDVHARDIIDSFVRDSILDEREFEWESQLRFYWEREPDELIVRQCTGEFGYGYEYMGLNGRLVITPLTDRIYLTLTQALSMKLGGAPAGPAGTGKTETTKDLAKALGLLCVVTNCGEGMDYRVRKITPILQLHSRRFLLLFESNHHQMARGVHVNHSVAVNRRWARSSRACVSRARGAASTSSTASTFRCCPSSRRSSPPSGTRCSWTSRSST